MRVYSRFVGVDGQHFTAFQNALLVLHHKFQPIGPSDPDTFMHQNFIKPLKSSPALVWFWYCHNIWENNYARARKSRSEEFINLALLLWSTVQHTMQALCFYSYPLAGCGFCL